MSSILERAIVHLLNEEEDKAKALFHKFMVEKARSIHESLRTGEDVDLGEGWDDELTSAEYFTADDLDGAEDEHADGEPTDTDGAADTISDDLHGDDDGEEHDDALALGDDASADDADATDPADGDDVHDAIQKLVDEFEEMMTKLDGIEDAVGGDDAGDEPADASDEPTDTDASDDQTDDDEPTGDEPTGQKPVEEEDEYDDLDDITESVMAELEKITVNLVDGKEIGDGKTITQNSKSSLPTNSAGQRNGAKPIEQKFDANDSFDRQPSPTVRDGRPARNSAKSAEQFRSPVAKGGDSSASLNKDFAGGPKPSKSTIDGK